MTTRAPLPDATPTTAGTAPPLVRAIQRLESWDGADAVSRVLGPISGPLGHEPLRGLLLGRGSGHALHPVLTDLAIGFWTSSATLDLLRRGRSAEASRALVGWGVLSALPTAVTGLATARKVGSRDAAYEVDGVGPQLRRPVAP